MMFTMDMPTVPMQETPIVLAQAVVKNSTTQPDYLLKTCTESSSGGRGVKVSPSESLAGELVNRRGQSIAINDFYAMAAAIKITQLQDTVHGKMMPQPSTHGAVSYVYRPDSGYMGKDQATFMAEFEGVHYKLIINFVITEGIDEDSPQCPPPQLIKVPKPAKPSSGASNFGAGYDLSSVSVTFAGLPGSALSHSTP